MRRRYLPGGGRGGGGEGRAPLIPSRTADGSGVAGGAARRRALRAALAGTASLALSLAGCSDPGPGLPVGAGGPGGDGDDDGRPAPRWSQVAAGDGFSCGLAPDGRAFCWGDRAGGALGDGETGGSSPVPVRVEADLRSDLRFDTLVAGRGHACGLTGDGDAWCWGDSRGGQVGAATPERCLGDGGRFACSSRPRRVAVGTALVALTAGGEHTCGLTGGGTLACWGSNEVGQLGRGRLGGGGVEPRAVPGFVFRSAAAGGAHTCGLDGARDVLCWGGNRFGQLGDGTRVASTFPATVAIRGASAVAAGRDHACVLGPAHCWGRDDAGQLGDGLLRDAPFPVPVAGAESFLQIEAGAAHTCGIADGGEAFCWGRGADGALGVDSLPPARPTPAPVEGDRSWRDLAAGADHTCGVTDEGRAFCWGRNGRGQLGDGTRDDRTVPVEVAAPR